MIEARIELEATRALYVGHPPDLRAHAALAANYVFALEGTLHIESGRETLTGVRVAFVPPGVRRHDVFRPEDVVASLWTDPLDTVVERAKELEVCCGRLRGGDLPDLREAIARGTRLSAIPGRPRLPSDHRVARVVRMLREGEGLELDLSSFARDLGVSRWHLMRCFRQHVGLTFRQYRTLARLYAALRRFRAGAPDWTAAALQAGFASTAHFSATFSKVFGMPVSTSAVSKRR